MLKNKSPVVDKIFKENLTWLQQPQSLVASSEHDMNYSLDLLDATN